jgi:thioredoxin reductase
MMQAVKKALNNVIDREQKRTILVTLSHDEELVIKGDNMSVSNLEQHETVKIAFKTILTEVAEEDETSYSFGGQLTFSETDTLDFPKMFAKMGGKKWNGGEIAKILAKYLSLLGFGLNASKTY